MPPNSEKYESDDPLVDPKSGILINKLGLTDEKTLERAESRALVSAYDLAAQHYSETHRFTPDDVCHLHRMFLSDIFDWAGEYRRVDISSPDIRWCHAKFIGKEMDRFGKLLAEKTPFDPTWSREKILAALAEIHGEFIVIHPFRDGNGRTGRMLVNLLLMQAERLPIQMGAFDDKQARKEYFAAIREVWAKMDYARLIRFFDQLLPQD